MNEPASRAERSSFGVNHVDNRRAPFDEACGRDAALQCIYEQAGANPFADPALI